jgi:hypothetical protein
MKQFWEFDKNLLPEKYLDFFERYERQGPGVLPFSAAILATERY